MPTIDDIQSTYMQAISTVSKIICITVVVGMAGCEHMGPAQAPKLMLEPLTVKDDLVDKTSTEQALDSTESEQEKVAPIAPEIWEAKGSTVHFHKEKTKAPASGKYTLNFDDADLSEVAKVILGDTLNENYVLSPRVGGRVTLQTSRPLTRDELLPALEMLLRMNNAVLLRGEGVFKIEPAANALRGINAPALGVAGRQLPPGYQIRIVPLRFIGVQEIQEILKPIIDPKALIRADSTRNLLMLAGTSEELENILETVHMFDVDWMKGMSAGLITLQYVEVATALTELENIFGQGSDGPLAGVVKMVPLERLNAILVITPQPAYLQEVQTWISRLDKTAPEGIGGEGVYVYKVSNVVAEELAQTLNDIFTGKKKNKTSKASLAPGRKSAKVTSKDKRSNRTNASSRVNIAEINDVRIVPDVVNNALVITATQGEYEAIKGVIKQLDVVPLQVLIDAMIVEVSLGDTLKYGVEWSARWGNTANAGNFSGPLSTAATDGDAAGGNAASTTTDEVPTVLRDNGGGARNGINGLKEGLVNIGAEGLNSMYTYGVMKGFQIQADLNALAQNNVLNVISTPSLLVLNNQEAFINVGDRVPIPTTQSTNTNSVNNNNSTVVANNIQYQDTGVTLKVTPRVNPGGLVIMEIEQTSDAAVVTTSSSLNAPTIRQRKITSSLAVQNGDTVVLGGLIQETRTTAESGIPILRKLPLIGPLFGTTSKGLDRTELIVLLTPRVIENRQDAREATRELQRKLSGVFQEHTLKDDLLKLERSDLVKSVSEGL